VDTATGTLDKAVAHLLALQEDAGYWKGELETNVTMEAEDLLLRRFLGILDEDTLAATARWIRSKQREDGTWATFFGGPADLSTTVEAYVALRLAGDGVEADHMQRAVDFIRANGGLPATRVFTRIWLALFGAWPWTHLPVLPPEMVFLPKWCPLNIYDFACWARQTIVPLTIVSALRPVRPGLPDLGELASDVRPPAPRRTPAGIAFALLDRVLHVYSRRPLKGLRRLALRRAAEWVVARQEADGSWGGIQPPWVYSLIALNLMGYPVDHPVVAAGLAGLDGFTVRWRPASRRFGTPPSP
jgi:squalene-hopene/tetraprenyl-beta-curcumene cyclase